MSVGMHCETQAGNLCSSIPDRQGVNALNQGQAPAGRETGKQIWMQKLCIATAAAYNVTLLEALGFSTRSQEINMDQVRFRNMKPYGFPKTKSTSIKKMQMLKISRNETYFRGS